MPHHVLSSLPPARAVDTLCPKCGSRTFRVQAKAMISAQVTFNPDGTCCATELLVPARDQTWTDTSGARCVRCAHTAPLTAFQQPRMPVTLKRLRALAGQPPTFDASHCLAVLTGEGLTSLSDAALPAVVEDYRITWENGNRVQDDFCID